MFQYRIRAILIVIFGGLLMVTTRLFYLQVVTGPHYTEYARNIRLSSHTLPTLRGPIVSADGVVLAADLPAFDIAARYRDLDPLVEGSRWRTVMLQSLKNLFKVPRGDKLTRIRLLEVEIVPDENGFRALLDYQLKIRRDAPHQGLLSRFVKEQYVTSEERSHGEIEIPPQIVERTRSLSQATGEPLSSLLERIVKAGVQIARLRASARQLIPVIKNVDYTTVRAIECRPDLFKGFEASRRAARSYPHGNLAGHTIGYMTVANEDDLREFGEAYHGDRAKRLMLGDEIGRTGLEARYDEVLRGRRGHELAEVDYLRRKQESLEYTASEKGHSLHLTLDMRWQRAAERALGQAAGFLGRESAAGAVVVLDVNSGAVLAIASHPGYDLNRFRRDFALLNDPERSPEKPLFNRATAYPLPPGSIFKIVGAVAATNAGISTTRTFDCWGRFRIQQRRCHSHGTVDLAHAIKGSCNFYFWEAALLTEPEPLAKQARTFGLGAKTGIDLPGERAGRMPSPSARWESSGRGWHPGDTLNVAIGQGEVEATPVQIARMVAAVANGGKLFRPHLASEVVAASGETITAAAPANEYLQGTVQIDPIALEAIRRGMKAVVAEPGGTAYKTFRGFDRFTIAGKTGTAQRKTRNRATSELEQDNVGWFAGYAPAGEPTIAFAVVLEHLQGDQGGGGTAGKVARLMFETVDAPLMPGEPSSPLRPIKTTTSNTP